MKPLYPTKTIFWMLTGIGIIVSGYLSFSHYRVFTDITYQSLCAISKTVNCDTVSQSPWAILIGVPVPAWGVIGYGFFLCLFLLLSTKTPGTQASGLLLLLFLASGFCAYSITLAAISAFLIKSYCLMCIALHVINFGLLLTSYYHTRKAGFRNLGHRLGNELGMLVKTPSGRRVLMLFSMIVTAAVLFYPPYWKFESTAAMETIPNGVTGDGHFYLGAAEPVLDIVEFTDYQCFQCKKMHFMLRRLMAAHPGKIRLVHRHFPMDHQVNPLLKEPFHTGSGAMAMLAIFAGTKGKFWQMNDVLFLLDPSETQWKIRKLLEKAGIVLDHPEKNIYSSEVQQTLRQDIMDGLKLGITATPSFLIRDNVYEGQIPAEILEQALQ